MKLMSVFLRDPVEEAEKTWTMMGAMVREWRLIVGLPIASLIPPTLMGAPPEETIVWFLMTLFILMPCAVGLAIALKWFWKSLKL